ncbi:MAG: PEP-CTERM sorting domain-containing protein [Gemmatimonadaceae bacterium]
MNAGRFTITPSVLLGATLLSASALSSTVAHAQTVFQASGANAAAIQGSVDGFRTALGTLNANVAGSFGTGRREINWDGVPENLASPNNLAPNFFNVNSPRGVVFSTPGTGFQVSGTGANNNQFSNLEPTAPSFFEPFSQSRLFTSIGSNITDVNFFIPGLTQAATTTAFGAVFSDVDFSNASSIEFFDTGNSSLGKFFVPAADGNETFSFLGVNFTGGQHIGRVRITAGNGVLGAGDLSKDLVALDDFIYAEPNAVVPEPASVVLMGAGLSLLMIGYLRKSNRRSI